MGTVTEAKDMETIEISQNIGVVSQTEDKKNTLSSIPDRNPSEIEQAQGNQEKIIQAYEGLMKASEVVPKEFFTPKSPDPPFGEQLAKIFQSLPRELGYAIVFCFTVLIAILAWSPAFKEFVLVFGICSIIMYLLSAWHKNKKIEADKHLHDVAKNINAISKKTGQFLATTGQKMHEKTMETIKEVAKGRADVKKVEIETGERMHRRGLENELKIKNLQEDGETKRNRNTNATRKEITEIDAKGKENVASINAEAEKVKLEIERQIAAAHNEKEIQIKNIEQTRAQQISEIENETRVKIQDMQTRLETAKISSANDVEKERIKEEIDRARIEGEMKKRQAELETQAEINRANQEAAARVQEAQNRGKKGDCIIC